MREESLRSSKEQPIKEIIAKFLKAHSLDEKMKEMDVIAAWPGGWDRDALGFGVDLSSGRLFAKPLHEGRVSPGPLE